MPDSPVDAHKDRDELSPEEFANRSGLSVSTVRRYIKAGVLPHTQPRGYRGRILVPANALAIIRDQSVNRVPNDPESPPSQPAPRLRAAALPKWMQDLENT